jgi:hypothetical protein
MKNIYHVVIDNIQPRLLDNWQNILQILSIFGTLFLGFIAAIPAMNSLPRLRTRIQHSNYFKFPNPKLIVTNMSTRETILFCVDTRYKDGKIFHQEINQKLSEGVNAEFPLNWSVETEIIYKSIRVFNSLGKSWKVPKKDIRRINKNLRKLYKDCEKVNEPIENIGTKKLGNGGYIFPFIKKFLSFRNK